MRNIYIIFICNLMLFSLPASAAIYKCTNAAGKVEFTDRPCKSGTREESMEKKSTGSPPSNSSGKLPEAEKLKILQESGIKYLDSLKKCKPYVHSFELPLFGKVENKIIGKNKGRCHVILNNEMSGESVCNFSDKTIALLTSEEKYQQIRNGEFSGGSSAAAEGSRMTAECVFSSGL